MADEPRAGEGNQPQAMEGRYANYFQVGHNAFEVVVEFGQHYEGSEQPLMHTRIVMSPSYAQELSDLLRGSLDRHRAIFGTVRTEAPHE